MDRKRQSGHITTQAGRSEGVYISILRVSISIIAFAEFLRTIPLFGFQRLIEDPHQFCTIQMVLLLFLLLLFTVGGGGSVV